MNAITNTFYPLIPRGITFLLNLCLWGLICCHVLTGCGLSSPQESSHNTNNSSPSEIPPESTYIEMTTLEGQTEIYVESGFEYLFSKSVKTYTVKHSSFFIQKTAMPVDDTVICDETQRLNAYVFCQSGRKCFLKPKKDLLEGTVYTICLTSEVQYFDGYPFEAIFINFQTSGESPQLDTSPQECKDGYEWNEGQCLPLPQCITDNDCRDGLTCNGTELCLPDSTCSPGDPIHCSEHSHCTEPEGECLCDEGYEWNEDECVPEEQDLVSDPSRCVPQAPVLMIIHAGATLQFSVNEPLPIQIGTSLDVESEAPATWIDTSTFTLSNQDAPYSIKIFSRVNDNSCAADEPFSHIYEVREHYPPTTGQAETTAISKDDPLLAAWATDWIDPVNYGENIHDQWKTPERALGPALGTPADIVSLGEGGDITMTFDPGIRNGSGWDFAVFENSFSATFLELAFVNVSSDGNHFVRFDNAYLGNNPIGGFGGNETTLIGSLAGKYPQGWGTPFDLTALENKPLVREGTVDLNHITHVKIIDIIGDGTVFDSFGNIIYDPFPTEGSAGFDLEAIGVRHTNN